MCDIIDFDGEEISTIREDKACLCNSTQDEIAAFIFNKMDLGTDESVKITNTIFGWIVEKC